MNRTVTIAGTGRVAGALGRLLESMGEEVAYIAHSDFLSGSIPCTPRVILAVPDRAIPEVAAQLAKAAEIRIALHTSGNLGPEALQPLQAHGAACGTLHPLQTVSGPDIGDGVAFAIWGDPLAVEWASRIVAAAKGEILRIPPEFRPLYHAAAVMASNYVMALIDAAQTAMTQCGVEPDAALRALGPLIRKAVENSLARGPVASLTGPIERGDSGTVAAHLRVLDGRILELYRAAGMQTADMARRRGLDSGRVREIEALLNGN